MEGKTRDGLCHQLLISWKLGVQEMFLLSADGLLILCHQVLFQVSSGFLVNYASYFLKST